MPALDLRESIQSALAAFADRPLRQAAKGLLNTLGYESERTFCLISNHFVLTCGDDRE